MWQGFILQGGSGGDVTSEKIVAMWQGFILEGEERRWCYIRIDCGHVIGFHTKWGGEAVMLQGLMRSYDRVSYSNMGRAHGGVLVRSRKPHHRYYFSCSLTSWESLDTAAVSHSWHWAFVYDKFTYYAGQGNGFMLLWSGLMLSLGAFILKIKQKKMKPIPNDKMEARNPSHA